MTIIIRNNNNHINKNNNYKILVVVSSDSGIIIIIIIIIITIMSITIGFVLMYHFISDQCYSFTLLTLLLCVCITTIACPQRWFSYLLFNNGRQTDTLIINDYLNI